MKKIKKKVLKPVTLEQWIEVRRKNGEYISMFFPPNRELEKIRQDMDPQPSLVYRRINFVHGVPEDYNWTEPDAMLRQRGGFFLHRFKIEEWPVIMQLEARFGNHHALPANDPQERPEAFGPCPCERCKAKRDLEDNALNSGATDQ